MRELSRRAAYGVAVILAGAVVAGCGSSGHAAAAPAKLRRAGGGIPRSLLAGVRPIGRGIRYRPPATGPVIGSCQAPLGHREEAHIELFGNNRVVLLAAGIGTRPPRTSVDGQITAAACFGSLVTLDPTGTVYTRPGADLTVGDLFRSWGQPLSATQLASFHGGPVRVYVNGVRRAGNPATTPLSAAVEIVLEIGPRVPPHDSFTFPALPSGSTP
jgi:hypothetical protein